MVRQWRIDVKKYIHWFVYKYFVDNIYYIAFTYIHTKILQLTIFCGFDIFLIRVKIKNIFCYKAMENANLDQVIKQI